MAQYANKVLVGVLRLPNHTPAEASACQSHSIEEKGIINIVQSPSFQQFNALVLLVFYVFVVCVVENKIFNVFRCLYGYSIDVNIKFYRFNIIRLCVCSCCGWKPFIISVFMCYMTTKMFSYCMKKKKWWKKH